MDDSRGLAPLAIAVLAGAVAVQAGLMIHLGERAYGDVLKALNFGYLVDVGAYRPSEDVINSKTFVGPWITHRIFVAYGLTGLRVVNVLAFLAIAAVALRLWRRYDTATRLLALVLFAFYVGTLRSVVAGELDDQFASLLMAAGVLVLVERRAVVAACLLFGVGFLFKFWVAIFGVGLVAWLVVVGRSRQVPLALLGLGAPILTLALRDGGASLRSLTMSAEIQAGYSTWTALILKVFSTALLPFALVAAAAWRRRRGDEETLFLLLGLSYAAYVFAARDSHATSTMTMTCLVFWAPLVAFWGSSQARALAPATRRAAALAFVVLYIAAATTVAGLHLRRDANPVRLVRTPAEAAKAFGYNRPPHAWR